jgi:DNA segregation ATPase FtsK/SpoIIIE, S-DNA-T family
MGKIKVPKILPEIDNQFQETFFIIVCLATFILLYLSLIDMGGTFGSAIASLLRMLLGKVAFVIPIFFLITGVLFIQKQQNPNYKSKLFNFRSFWGFGLITLMLAGIFNVFLKVQNYSDNYENAGGLVGFFLYPLILKPMGVPGATVILLSVGITGFFLVTQLTVVDFFAKCKEMINNPSKVWELIPDVYELWRTDLPSSEIVQNNSENLDDMISSVIYDGSIGNSGVSEDKTSDGETRNKRRKKLGIFGKDTGSESEEDKIKEFIDVVISKPDKNKPKFTAVSDGDGLVDMSQVKTRDDGNWKSPASNLLKISKEKSHPGDIERNKQVIKDTLEHFGIKVQMGDTYIGPTVTQYTLKPANGVRLSTIDGLQRDISLALASPSIRIEAPIQGKSLVGIEIPNEKKSPVRLGDIIYHPKFQQFSGDLPIAIGKDVAGKEMVYSLAKAPHLLVAGATGAGKSVWINSMLLSLITNYSPYDLQLIMVDMKRVELKLYEGIPHLMCSVITEADKAINSLKWTVLEMDRRYSLLERFGKRNIVDYNDYVKTYKSTDEEKPESMPYLVFIIDELGDLMMIAKTEVEPIIVRLTQMSRAVGIHLVLGTQRPDTNVVTGLIKANIPTRIAFTVASQIDSRVILDSSGAEKLLGLGDGLISTPSLMKPIRFQGPNVEESEVVAHVQALKKQAKEINFNNQDDTITQTPKTKINVPGMSNARRDRDDAEDEAYQEAKRTVVAHQKASTSFLQQTMGVGYPKAAKLINKLEQNGIVGPQNGSKPRDVYILPDEMEFDEE